MNIDSNYDGPCEVVEPATPWDDVRIQRFNTVTEARKELEMWGWTKGAYIRKPEMRIY